MIKLQDFARQQGVTDRAIQKHLAKYADELEGLFQRRGPNGTWLTEEACEILRGKMKQAPATVFEPDPRVGQLQQELESTKAAAKELWEQFKQKEQSMALLIEQSEQYRLKADSVARLEADNEQARKKVEEIEAQNAVLSAEKAEAEDKARLEAAAAQRATEGLQRAEEEKAAWKEYAAALEAYNALGWFKRRKAEKPVPPAIAMEER